MIQAIIDLFKDLSDSSAISLSTVHKAKGLEYDSVFMLESTFGFNSTEEENLWYVCVTRTKKTLYMVKGKINKKEIVEI
jgi:superfamily I DNA/RNA helicase